MEDFRYATETFTCALPERSSRHADLKDPEGRS
jgi:hypothetical protein